jgi:hypothetical protein
VGKPKGPPKVGRHIRLLETTDAVIDAEAKKRKMAVPTFITMLLEAKFGVPTSENEESSEKPSK